MVEETGKSPEKERAALACGYSFEAASRIGRAVALLEKDGQVPEDQRQAMRETWAKSAVELLEASVKRGSRELDRMKKDPDLDPFREREDFQELLRTLVEGREDSLESR